MKAAKRISNRVRVCSVLLFVLLAGCHASAPPQPTVKADTGASRRFVQVQNGNPANNLPGSLALDTKTGQLCRTYEWTGVALGASKIPLCIDLYRTNVFASLETTGGLPKVGETFDGKRVIGVRRVK